LRFAAARRTYVNADRFKETRPNNGEPLEDVHCRVEGPAAHRLLKTFILRWQVPSGARSARRPQRMVRGWLRGETEPAFHQSGAMPTFAILGTVNRVLSAPLGVAAEIELGLAAEMAARLLKEVQAWAKIHTGHRCSRTSELSSLIALIATHSSKPYAPQKHFIYFEEPVSHGIVCCRCASRRAQRWSRRAPSAHHILVNTTNCRTRRAFQEMRGKFIDTIFSVPSAKGSVGIFYSTTQAARNPSGPVRTCTPRPGSLTTKLAFIGTANVNNRGLSSDSEVGVCVLDRSPSDTGPKSFAQNLRMQLWAKHLGVSPDTVVDGLASARLWGKTTPASRFVALYQGTDPYRPAPSKVVRYGPRFFQSPGSIRT